MSFGTPAVLKRLLVGRPIPSHHAQHERLSRVTGLAVLSSDALSSVAYATEEILRVLLLAGAAALALSGPIALVIALILAIVAASYHQTIHAYPGGGGAYLVARDNLGELPSLIAAASLLIDYVLTVAVSISSAVANLASSFEALHGRNVAVAIGCMRHLDSGDTTRLEHAPEFIHRMPLIRQMLKHIARHYLVNAAIRPRPRLC